MGPSKIRSNEYVLIVHGIPIRPTRDAWQPVKDLLRKIMVLKPDEIHREPGAVNMQPSGFFSCGVKDERTAWKFFNYLKCSEWYGSRLMVWLWLYEGGGGKPLSHSIVLPNDEPRRLELMSPIKDSMLLRQQQRTVPTMPLLIAGNLPIYEAPNTAAAFISSPIATSVVHSPLSSVATTRFYSGTMQATDRDAQSIMLSNEAQGYTTSMVTPELLQQYAFRAFQNHSFGHYGETQLPVTNSDSISWATHPVTTAGSFGGFSLTPTCGYPFSHSYPLVSTPSAPRYLYHANPDGTLVNTTQGTVSVYESRAIVVRNLYHRATAEEIREHFSAVGAVENLDMGANRKESKKRTAKMTYHTAAAARAAVTQFNGVSWKGRIISAEIAKDDSAIDSNLVDSGASLAETASTSAGKSSQTQETTEVKPRSGPLIVNGSDEDMVNALPREIVHKGKEKDEEAEDLIVRIRKVNLSD